MREFVSKHHTEQQQRNFALCLQGQKGREYKAPFLQAGRKKVKESVTKGFFPHPCFQKIKDQRKAWLTFSQHQGFFCSCKEEFLVSKVPLLLCFNTKNSKSQEHLEHYQLKDSKHRTNIISE